MGGSRRRLKRNAPKVRVGVVKRKKSTKAAVPQQMIVAADELGARLGGSMQWQQEVTLNGNYGANRLCLDPNQGFGRNARPPLKDTEERRAEDGATHSDDDELRAACNLERKTGRALPKRLSAHQRTVVDALIAKHGDDVQAMARDRKLNAMQHSVGKLRELLTAHAAWAPGAGHDFRAPNKAPSRPLLRGVRTG